MSDKIGDKMRVHHSSEDMSWTTPPDFFAQLDSKYCFTLDPAAASFNAVCENYFTEKEDGLKQDWSGHRVFVNPPYGRALPRWIEKAAQEAEKGTLIVMLIPARTDTKAWHTHIFGNPRAKVVFIQGRLKFGQPWWDEAKQKYVHNPAPFPSALIIFNEEAGVKPRVDDPRGCKS